MRKIAVLSAAMLAACGSSKGTTTNNNNNSSDLATFCTSAASASTDVFVNCFHANPDYVSSLTSSALFDCTGLTQGVSDGRIGYDSAQAAACSSAMGSMTCGELIDEDVPAACKSALTGKVANGGACHGDLECVSGLCTATTGRCPGVCEAVARLDESCVSLICAAGLGCDSSNTCKALSAVNGACPCQAGLWCDTSGGPPGVCKARLTSGACSSSVDSCQFGYACVGSPATTCQPMVGLGGDCSAGPSLCGPGYLCDGATHQCVSYPKIGEACGAAGLCIASFCDFLGTQKCVAYKHVGDACAQTDLIPCEPGSTCDTTSSKCTVKPLCF